MTTPTPFLLEPDGASPRGERLSFGTDVETHRDGSERRAAFRAYPRLTLSAGYTFLIDDTEAALAPLRDGGTLLVPAWQHKFFAYDGSPPVADMGVPLTGAQPFLVRATNGTWRTDSFGFGADGQLAGWSAADYLAVPLHTAELSEDSFSLEYATPTVRTVSLSFDVTENLEAPAPWPDSDLTFPQRHNWRTGVADSTSFRTNRFDAGNLRLREKLYSKRTVSIEVLLSGRAAIAEFRSWVYATGGRLNSFTWKAPQDQMVKRWRLSSDDVELQYLNPALATCSLSLVEVSA